MCFQFMWSFVNNIIPRVFHWPLFYVIYWSRLWKIENARNIDISSIKYVKQAGTNQHAAITNANTFNGVLETVGMMLYLSNAPWNKCIISSLKRRALIICCLKWCIRFDCKKEEFAQHDKHVMNKFIVPFNQKRGI